MNFCLGGRACWSYSSFQSKINCTWSTLCHSHSCYFECETSQSLQFHLNSELAPISTRTKLTSTSDQSQEVMNHLHERTDMAFTASIFSRSIISLGLLGMSENTSNCRRSTYHCYLLGSWFVL